MSKEEPLSCRKKRLFPGRFISCDFFIKGSSKTFTNPADPEPELRLLADHADDMDKVRTRVSHGRAIMSG